MRFFATLSGSLSASLKSSARAGLMLGGILEWSVTAVAYNSWGLTIYWRELDKYQCISIKQVPGYSLQAVIRPSSSINFNATVVEMGIVGVGVQLRRKLGKNKTLHLLNLK